jgi:hypothetical protein
MLGGFLHICTCTCTIYCDLWTPDNTCCIFLTWYQSKVRHPFATSVGLLFPAVVRLRSPVSLSLAWPRSSGDCGRSRRPVPSEEIVLAPSSRDPLSAWPRLRSSRRPVPSSIPSGRDPPRVRPSCLAVIPVRIAILLARCSPEPGLAWPVARPVPSRRQASVRRHLLGLDFLARAVLVFDRHALPKIENRLRLRSRFGRELVLPEVGRPAPSLLESARIAAARNRPPSAGHQPG